MIKMKPKRQGVKLGVERRSDKESKTVLHWNDKESSSTKRKGNKRPQTLTWMVGQEVEPCVVRIKFKIR